jgi:hypothetical protein
MNFEKGIFGLRFHADVSLYPSREDLAAFLAGPAGGGDGHSHGSELVEYHQLIDAVKRFERPSPQSRRPSDLGRQVFFGVVSHTRFASSALASAVEHYKYLFHALRTVDLRKPAVFIRSAEAEMAKLNPKKKDQAERLNRLQQLIDERKRALEDLRYRRSALGAELRAIAGYVRDNLIKIEKLCTTSLIVLSDASLSEQAENRLVEDTKSYFRHQVKEARDNGTITKEYLDELKQDVATLAREIPAIRRAATVEMMRLYDELSRHAREIGREINTLILKLGERWGEGDTEDQRIFYHVERQLVRLVTVHHLEIGRIEIRTDTAQESVFEEKAREALSGLIELVRGERRSTVDRRRGRDRRMFNPIASSHPERRTGNERRSGRDRRSPALPFP